MRKIFPIFLLVVFFSLVFPLLSSAQVSKIVFTTDSQTIKPNEISGAITIQAQDSGGNSYQTPETLDLEFLSTSATGEFLGSTGNPATAYMSKNTANRTFYYRDSSEGNFIITINAKGRDTGQEWSTNQQITVSSNGSQNETQNSSGEVLSSSSSSSSSGSRLSGNSTTNVSSPNSQLEILAGSDRTTSLGSPIWFQAAIRKNNTPASPDLNWSFGDGYVAVGSLVSHIYKYAGDYVVVLSAKAGDAFSVSRLKVRVVEPSILVFEGDEYLEISNKSDTEINLFNWRVENKGRGFIFQPNTIILPRSSIKIDKKLLSMKGFDNSLGVSLKNNLGEEIFSTAPAKEIDLKKLSKELEDAKNRLALLQEKAKNIGLVSQNRNFDIQAATALVSEPKILDEERSTTTAEFMGDIIYEAPKESSFIFKLTNFIKRVFSN